MTIFGEHEPQVDKSLLTLVRSDKPGPNPDKKVEIFSAEEIYEIIDGAIKISINGFSHTSRGYSNYQKLFNKIL